MLSNALSSHERPDVFNYLNYREFLKDSIQYLRSQKMYSVRKFAQRVGFKGSNYMKLIVDGKRNLTDDSAAQVGLALELPKNKIIFFVKLVKFNQIKDFNQKNEIFYDLMKSKKSQLVREVEFATYELFSNWYIIPMLEALGTSWSKLTTEGMAQSLGVKKEQVDDALNILQNLKLIEKNSRGEWKKLDIAIKTPDQIKELAVRNFHRECMKKAIEALDYEELENREVHSITIGLSKKNYNEVKRRIIEFRKEINAVFSDEPEVDKIYQISFALFPVLNVRFNPKAHSD